MAIPDFTATAGSLDVYSVTVPAAWLGSETIASVTAGLQIWQYSPIADASAATLLRGTPSLSSATGSAWIGGIASTTNLVAGAVYNGTFWFVTSSGRVLPCSFNLSVSAASPATATTNASLPASEYSKTASFTPAAPGTYLCNGSGIVVTIPAASVGGDIVIVNNSTTQTVTLSGSALNYFGALPSLSPGATLALHWVALQSGFVII